MGLVSIRRTNNGIARAQRSNALSAGRALELSFSDMGGAGRMFGPLDRVLIKPNLNDDVCYTNKELVAALVALLRDAGVSDIAIGESTFGNADSTERLFRATEYKALSKELGVRLINFNASRPVRTGVPNPILLDSVLVAEEVFLATKRINIPVMKVHYATDVSLGLKNLKGFLVGSEKRRFHEAGLDSAIADLNKAVTTHLTLIDCIECMETMGPKGGDIKRLDAIIMAEDIADADTVGAKVMGFEPEEIGHIRAFIERAPRSPSQIELRGDCLDSIISPFKRATIGKELLAKHDVYDKGACSACVNALILSLRFAGSIDRRLAFFIASGELPANADSESCVAFGNCSAAKNAGIRIKGCPPYPFELAERLSLRK